jgi:ABC-2 type transport system ATP-binding protein
METVTLFRSFYPRGMSSRPAMARVGLEDKAGLDQASVGGQRQRLAVAVRAGRAIRVLFLDEPTTGLDPAVPPPAVGDHRRVPPARKAPSLLTTHYMEEAERLCDRVAIVDHGRIIASGTPRELIDRLGSNHVVEFSLATPAGGRPPSECWSDLPAVLSCRQEGAVIHLAVSEPHRVLPALVERLEQRKWELASLVTRHASLDDVFVSLTGRPLDGDHESSDEEAA